MPMCFSSTRFALASEPNPRSALAMRSLRLGVKLGGSSRRRRRAAGVGRIGAVGVWTAAKNSCSYSCQGGGIAMEGWAAGSVRRGCMVVSRSAPCGSLAVGGGESACMLGVGEHGILCGSKHAASKVHRGPVGLKTRDWTGANGSTDKDDTGMEAGA